jgi:hypothetical protein
MENSLLDKTFRDGEGKIVIAQPPNLPLMKIRYYNSKPMGIDPATR